MLEQTIESLFCSVILLPNFFCWNDLNTPIIHTDRHIMIWIEIEQEQLLNKFLWMYLFSQKEI